MSTVNRGMGRSMFARMAAMVSMMSFNAANSVPLEPSPAEKLVPRPLRHVYCSPSDWFRGKRSGKPRKSSRLHMARKAKMVRRRANK